MISDEYIGTGVVGIVVLLTVVVISLLQASRKYYLRLCRQSSFANLKHDWEGSSKEMLHRILKSSKNQIYDDHVCICVIIINCLNLFVMLHSLVR